jgi:hypothetical protein
VAFVSPLGKVTCPHCSEQFHLSKAPHRLVGLSAPTAADQALEKHFGSPMPPMGQVDDSMVNGSIWRRLRRRFYLPAEPLDQRRICPHCHINLPNYMASGEVGSEVFAIVGARNSGKSNYFGVLLHQLRRRYGAEVGFEVMDVSTFTPSGPMASHDLYERRYGQYLYDPKAPRAVEQTRSAVTTAGKQDDPRIPLIYLLRFPRRPWHYLTRPFTPKVPVYLMIFDAAGEDMTDPQTMELYYRFIARATGLIFLIDPFEYRGIRAQLPPAVSQTITSPVNADPAIIVDRVVQVWQKRRRLRAAAQINVPTAFVLTKADLFRQVKGLVYDRSPLFREPRHEHGYDQAGGEELSRELEQCVRDWDSPELVQKASNNFRTYSFFAVSALGALPDQQTLKLSQPPTPMRIADPLLWLFWQRGYLPSTRRP